jgi:hypothetical protein
MLYLPVVLGVSTRRKLGEANRANDGFSVADERYVINLHIDSADF